MSNVIVDTSSLISFALVLAGKYPADELNNPSDVKKSIEKELYKSVWSGFENTLEALVLYDELWVDGPSFKRNLTRYPELAMLNKHIKLLEISKFEEQNHYNYIQNFYSRIQGSQATAGLFKYSAISRYLAEEVEGLHRYIHHSIQHWEYVEAILPQDLSNISASLRVILKENKPWSSAALISILRLFYYQSLQSFFNTDLLLHPDKGQYYDEEVNEHDTPLSAKIVHMFDEKVRTKFYARKTKWLGNNKLQIPYPMLTQYILNKLNKRETWNEVINICIDIKHSKKARGFRHEITQMKKAINNNDNVKIDKTISALNKAVKEWSKDLSADIGPKKIIRLSLPIVPIVSTDLLVSDKNIEETPGEKLLIFIHELLSRS